MAARQAFRMVAAGLLALATTAPAAVEMPIVPGDRLAITVVGEADLSKTFTVDRDGNLALPLVGRLSVKDRSLAEVREELAKQLARFIRDPQVTVEFAERATITVGITGAVGKPGSVTVKKGSRLLDGIALVEGWSATADLSNARLQRRGEEKPRMLDLSLLSRDAALNLELQDGDALFVPPLPVYTIQVLGAVNRPGEVVRKEKPTILEAILAAGGVAPDADRRRVQILKKGAAGAEAVNLEDVLAGKRQDLVLGDGDTLTVPAIPRIRVKVFGSVVKTGEAEVRAGATVLDAVAAADGFAMEADRTAVFLTSASGEVRKLNLEKPDSPDGRLPLEEGASVFVPLSAPQRFAVAGGVNTPGQFPFPPPEKGKVHLTDALAQAGGMVERAKKKRIMLVRKNPDGGQPLVREINFDQIRKDPKLNVEILPNDVIYVDVNPERTRPNALEVLLGIAGAFF